MAVSGCQKSSPEYLVDARGQLAASAFDDAIASAEAGLAGSADAVTAWGLELVKLEAHARAGHADAVKEQLAKLAVSAPERISAADYTGAAQQLQSAKQGPAAIEILDMGKKRFPEDATIEKMIKASVAGAGDPAELEMLKSLGYIDE